MSKPNPKNLKIEFDDGADVEFSHASNLLINFDDDNFYIRFYQVKPPPVLEGDLPDTVKAKLVAGLVIPKARLEVMVKAIQENIARRKKYDTEDFEVDLESLDELEDDNE